MTTGYSSGWCIRVSRFALTITNESCVGYKTCSYCCSLNMYSEFDSVDTWINKTKRK